MTARRKSDLKDRKVAGSKTPMFAWLHKRELRKKILAFMEATLDSTNLDDEI